LREPKDWLLALCLTAGVFLAYQPAWNGKPIWDDDIHITAPELRSLGGLARIWTDPAAAVQYYPVLHTVFWIEYKLWRDWPLPYHLVNISLHLVAALLLVKIVRRLALPGAWLAAALFALHPVHVESVAWFSEMKNTLSTAFFLAAMNAYLRFAQDRHRPAYVTSLFLFSLGVLTKTIILTLPAVLVIILWWKRGRLSWRRDLKPLVPFAVVALAAAAVTIWVERSFVAEPGEQFRFSLLDRILIAGRLFWFYLTNLFWPANLTLIYPAWNVDARAWWQYLFPISAAIFLGLLWMLRNRLRGPFAAVFAFTVMLSPVLGFFNLAYHMSRVSVLPNAAIFRADHFQYLADIALIVLVSAGAAAFMTRCRSSLRAAFHLAAVALLFVLAGLTRAQARNYRDAETCFRDVVSKNPASATAHNNLGQALLQRGAVDEAIAHLEKAVALKPDLKMAEFNLGHSLLQTGKIDNAMAHLRRAIELEPNYAKAYYVLATAYAQKNETREAIETCRRAIAIAPDFGEAHGTLGTLLLGAGEIDNAIAEYRNALEIDPNDTTTHYNLAVAYFRKNEPARAAEELRIVLRIQPGYPDAEDLLRDLERREK
jgi:protein O-mannosyl-transferase